MSRQDAQDCLDVLESLFKPPEYVIGYEQSILFSTTLRFFAISSGIAKYCDNPTEQRLSKVLDFKDGEVVFRKTNETLPAKRMQYDWGVVFLIEPEPGVTLIVKLRKVAEWFQNLDGLVKSVSAIVLAASVLLGSVFGLDIKLPAPQNREEKPMRFYDNKKRIKKVLEEGFNNLPNPYANGLYYWRYTGSCSKRELFASYSPFKNTKTDRLIKDLSVRFTNEDGWSEIFQAHEDGDYFILEDRMLSENNALRIAMEQLQIKTIVTLPTTITENGCPRGYLSGGYSSILTEDQKRRILLGFKRVILSIQAWETVHDDSGAYAFAFTL